VGGVGSSNGGGGAGGGGGAHNAQHRARMFLRAKHHRISASGIAGAFADKAGADSLSLPLQHLPLPQQRLLAAAATFCVTPRLLRYYLPHTHAAPIACHRRACRARKKKKNNIEKNAVLLRRVETTGVGRHIMTSVLLWKNRINNRVVLFCISEKRRLYLDTVCREQNAYGKYRRSSPRNQAPATKRGGSSASRTGALSCIAAAARITSNAASMVTSVMSLSI